MKAMEYVGVRTERGAQRIEVASLVHSYEFVVPASIHWVLYGPFRSSSASPSSLL